MKVHNPTQQTPGLKPPAITKTRNKATDILSSRGGGTLRTGTIRGTRRIEAITGNNPRGISVRNNIERIEKRLCGTTATRF